MRLAPGRLVALDLILAVWVVLWVWLALAIAAEVRGLAELSTTVSRVGTAVEQSGRALGGLEGLPLGIGDQLAEPSRRIEEAGRSAVSSGRSSRESVESLSFLLALAVGVIPCVPVFGFYLPLRLGVARERRALRRVAAQAAGEPAFEEFLARRALVHVPLSRLRAFSPEPWHDLEQGRYRALARAELQRLGVSDRLIAERRPR